MFTFRDALPVIHQHEDERGKDLDNHSYFDVAFQPKRKRHKP